MTDTLERRARDIAESFDNFVSTAEREEIVAPAILAFGRAVEAETIERAAKVAEGLNGWGSDPCPELADHIAKTIRTLQDTP